MKIFSIRNLLGVAAFYGAAQYAKKHGGPRNALEGLVTKVKEAAATKKEQLIGKAQEEASVAVGSQPAQTEQPPQTEEPPSVELGSYTSGYSTDFDGSGSTRRS